MRPSGLLSQPDDDVDLADFVAVRNRNVAEGDLRARNVDQFAVVLKKEVLMVADVGILIRLSAVDTHPPQQTKIRELVQRIVDGRQ